MSELIAMGCCASSEAEVSAADVQPVMVNYATRLMKETYGMSRAFYQTATVDKVRELLEAGADVNEEDSYGAHSCCFIPMPG